MKKYHLFISYSRKDDTTFKKRNPKEKSAVDIILECLKAAKIKYWIDREGKYCGGDFEEEICNALDDSEMLLFISSANSNSDDSKWVAREIKYALDIDMKIIPLLIDKTDYSKKFKLSLKPIDRRNYYEDPQTALNDVVETIEKHINIIKVKEYQDAEKKRIEKLKEDIAKLQIQLMGAINKQRHYLGKWIEKRKELTEELSENLICPVCQSLYDENADFCEICGWHFGLPKELLPDELQRQYEERLETSLYVWSQKESTETSLKSIQDAQTVLQTRINQLNKELDETKVLAQKRENTLKTKQEQLQKRLEQAEASAKSNAEEGEKALLAKQEQIAQLEKSLNDTKAQLAVTQKSIDGLKSKAEQAKALQSPIAFLLVTEFDQSDVYMLYEGLNVFGALAPQKQSPEYQMIVATEEKLMPRHFEIRINKKDKHFEFKVRPLSSACSLAYNSTTNTIETEQTIRVGDILYIGGMKINLIDNYNK